MSMPPEPTGTATEPNGDGTTTDPNASATDPAARIAALEAEVVEWKGHSRKHENAAKAALKATGKAPAEPVTETPKASSDGIAELRLEMARDKAKDKLEIAAAKAGVELDGLLEFVTVDKFLDGTAVQTDVIDTFVSNFAAKSAKAPKFPQNVGVGPQAGGAPGQLTKADIKGMTPEQITKATADGRFDRLLGKIK